MLEELKLALPLDQWGIGEAKTVEELMAEIRNGECEVIFDVLLDPIRVVRVARVFVTHKGRQLVETKQVMLDGRVRHRHIAGISEKLHASEPPHSGAIRGLKEELGIDIDFLRVIGNSSECKESKSYPELLCRYEFFDFLLEMPDELFRDEYIANEEGSTTYFGWEK